MFLSTLHLIQLNCNKNEHIHTTMKRALKPGKNKTTETENGMVVKREMRQILYCTAKYVHICILSPIHVICSSLCTYSIHLSFCGGFIQIFPIPWIGILRLLTQKYFRFSHIDFQSLGRLCHRYVLFIDIVIIFVIAIMPIFAAATTTNAPVLYVYDSVLNKFSNWWFAAYLPFIGWTW